MRVIASLTTMPKRINLLKDTLDSIRAQSFPVSSIELNVPYKCVRTGEDYVIPDWLLEYPVTICRTEDYGAITKIAPTLLRHKDEDVYLWSCDDDIRYPSCMLQLLMNKHEPYIKRVLTISSGSVSVSGFTANFRQGNTMILEGFATVLYPPNLIEDDFLSYVETTSANADCRVSDDVVLSNYVNSKGVLIYHCPRKNTDFDMAKCLLPQTHDADATHTQTGGHSLRYVRVLYFLKEKGLLSWNIHLSNQPTVRHNPVKRRVVPTVFKPVPCVMPIPPVKSSGNFVMSNGQKAGKRFWG